MILFLQTNNKGEEDLTLPLLYINSKLKYVTR